MKIWLYPFVPFVAGCILFGCGSSSVRKVETVPDTRPVRLTVETVVGPTGVVWECAFDANHPGPPACTQVSR